MIINYWPLQSLEKQHLFNSALCSVNDLMLCYFCSHPAAAVSNGIAWEVIFLPQVSQILC